MDSIWIRASGALALSVLLHGSVFLGLRPSTAGTPGIVVARPLLVRMLPAPFAITGAEVSERLPVRATLQTPLENSFAIATAVGSWRRIPVSPRSVEANGQSIRPQGSATLQSGREAREMDHSLVAASRPSAQSADAGLPAAPAYLVGARLDPGPRPLNDIEPAFPPEAGLQEGVVVLRILISEAGAVDDVAVVRSSPKGLFESSALAAFGSAKFSPGMVLGVPVKSQVTVEVSFTPFNRGAAVSGRGY